MWTRKYSLMRAVGNMAKLPLPKFFSSSSSSSSSSAVANSHQPLFTIAPKVLISRLEHSLKQKDTDETWRALQKLKRAGVDFPEKPFINESLALLADGDSLCLLRAHKIMSRLNKEEKLDYVGGDVLKSLSLAYAKAEMYDLSASAFRLMLQRHHHPPLTFWKSLLGLWVESPRGATYTMKVFLEICRYCVHAPSDDEQCANITPDKEAFNIALKACAVLGESVKADDIMKHMRHFSLKPDNACFCSLMKAHEKGGGIGPMMKVLLRMKQAQEVPTRATLNSLLTACINMGEVDLAAQVVLCWSGKVKDGADKSMREPAHRELHESLREWGEALERPCGDSCTLILKEYLQKNRVVNAARFLAKLFPAEESEYIRCSFALEGVLKHGLRDELNSTLQELATLASPADSLSYAMLAKSYCKLPQPLKAEAVLHDARRVGHSLDVGCYDAVIDAYNLLQDYDCAQRVFRDMKRHGVVPLEPILTKLLSFFEKHGKPYLMFKLLEAASHDPPLKLDVRHWNRAVHCFCKGKLMVDAKAVVRRMRQVGYVPDASTYVFLLSGYILMGNKTNEILLLWAEIKEKLAANDSQIKLNEELLNGFLAIFVKYGYFNNALDVIARMEERNIHADKQKYRNMYWHLHKDLYTSKHRSQQRVDMSQERRKQVQEFKSWVGLPA